MMKEITNKTILGWGYRTSIKQTDDGWYIPKPRIPNYFGTITSLLDKINHDTSFQFDKNGYYVSSWFAKDNGVWKRIVNNNLYDDWISELQEKKSIFVELEDCTN